MLKTELRNRLKKERAAISKEDRLRWDGLITMHLKNWVVLQKARRIMVYLSFGWEINTWPLVEELWALQKEVFVPVVVKSKRALLATAFTPETTLKSAAFGIQEPLSSEVIEPAALDLVIAPGLAFTPAGYRIGYGGGYYDRFLTRTKAVTVGLCYSQFLKEGLPQDPWDQPVLYIATEEGVASRK